MSKQKRRKKEHKTDYLKRAKLLKSNSPRLIFRKTNRYIIAQYVVTKEAKDKIEAGISSKHLVKYGWPKGASGKSISASYLTGLLFGKKISKLKKPIVDFGMIRVLHKTRAYAFLKGVIDSGVGIECEERCFPDDERIRGRHLKIKIQFDEIKSKILAG